MNLFFNDSRIYLGVNVTIFFQIPYTYAHSFNSTFIFVYLKCEMYILGTSALYLYNIVLLLVYKIKIFWCKNVLLKTEYRNLELYYLLEYDAM
jgi:hypothetical protein